jgi:hypothetical protein
MKKLFPSLLLFAGLAPIPAAETVVAGPVVVNATARAATVVWIVQSDEVIFASSGEFVGDVGESAGVLVPEEIKLLAGGIERALL